VKARFLLLWAAAVIATTMAFVVHLALRFETVRLGYDVGDSRADQRRLIEERRLLAIEAATLRHSDRIEAVAREAFRMRAPDPDQIVPVDGRVRRRASGRLR